MLELAMDNLYSTNRSRHTLYVIVYNNITNYLKKDYEKFGYVEN